MNEFNVLFRLIDCAVPAVCNSLLGIFVQHCLLFYHDCCTILDVLKQGLGIHVPFLDSIVPLLTSVFVLSQEKGVKQT